MQKINDQLIIRTDDYKILTSYLNRSFGKTAVDRRNREELKAELQRAMIVSNVDFPADVVRLNSTVQLKAEDKDEVLELMLVTPEKADIKKKRISIMAPVGSALIGWRQGQKVKWRVPAGNKTFTILKVTNEHEAITVDQ